MFEVDIDAMKDYIIKTGIKQKIIAKKSGMNQSQICRALQGERKLMAEEYINICCVLQVPITKFLKNKSSDNISKIY